MMEKDRAVAFLDIKPAADGQQQQDSTIERGRR
jgi:hypothetical protein